MYKYLSFLLLSLITLTLLNACLYAELTVPKKELSFEFMSLPWFPLSDKAAEVIVKQLEKVGIKLELRRLESKIMYPKIENFEYESYILATSQSPNPAGMITTFHSSRCKPGIGSFWGLKDPEVDKLIEEMRRTTDPDKLPKIIHKIQELVAERAGFIPIYLSMNTLVIRAEWKNYTIMPGGIIEAYNIWTMLYMYKSEKPEENVFKIAFPSDIMTTNPFMTIDLRSLWVLNLIYDPLVRLDPKLNIVPWLATSWEVSEDGKVWTFKLRKGVKWHDGKPFTADDVVFTFTKGIELGTPRFIDLKDYVEKVEKVDDYTVKFTLKYPYPFFLYDLATGYIYIVPKHIWEDKNITKWENPHPIGTGPFKWSERVAGEYIILVKNDDFWIPNVPKITKIIVKVIRESEARFMAIKRGEVDTERYSTPVTLVKQALKDPNLKVVTAPGLWLIYMAFNPFVINDPRVFVAIHYAINRTEVIEKANRGYGYPVYTILNKQWHGKWAATYIKFEYDPEKAKKILEEAGWIDIDGDGIREYVGITTPTTPSPTTPTPSPTPTATPTVITTTVTVTETKTVTSTITTTITTTAPIMPIIGAFIVILIIAVLITAIIMRRRR
mgnify:CR=1 FL=1